ncbi:MAG: hypothetical protein ACOYYJ_08445 [Chloroflexota bacterium]
MNPAPEDGGKMAESTNAPQTGNQFDNLSKRYPYLTAYVGFLALFALARMGIGTFLLMVGQLITTYMDRTPQAWVVQIGAWVLILAAGFYVFKYVIRKHVLPHVDKP